MVESTYAPCEGIQATNFAKALILEAEQEEFLSCSDQVLVAEGFCIDKNLCVRSIGCSLSKLKVTSSKYCECCAEAYRVHNIWRKDKSSDP